MFKEEKNARMYDYRREQGLSIQESFQGNLAVNMIDDMNSGRGTSSSRSYSDFHAERFHSEVPTQRFSGTFGRISSRSSSRRSSISIPGSVRDHALHSISLSRDVTEQILDHVDDEMFAQVGDSGDRIMNDEEEFNHEFEVYLDNHENFKNSIVLAPATSSRISNGLSLPTDTILSATEREEIEVTRTILLKEKQDKLPRRLDYLSYLVHLAVFGILGVLTRYYLQKLFGPNILALTGDNSPLYLDLPSNMLGSFLMGWFGIVFKSKIRSISDHLAVAISTGYMGSLTTFSGWNMKMLDLSSRGRWTFAVAGVVFGQFLVNESINIGVESAEGLSKRLGSLTWKGFTVNSRRRHAVVMSSLLLILTAVWAVSVVFAAKKLQTPPSSDAVLPLAFLVGPAGVWARWYLARLNGRGIGRSGHLRWLPVGTLVANVLAACVMAASSSMSDAVNTERFGLVVSGFQLGFLGCLSTVSTFVSEIYAMRQSRHSARALFYGSATIIPSFVLGTLVFSVPVWVKSITRSE